MDATPQCWHCQNMLAFGRFQLETTRWIQGTLHKEYLIRPLCADCGFNITNFAVSRLAQFVKEVKQPNGRIQHTPMEVMYRKFPYTGCTLIEVYEETAKLARERELQDQRERELIQREIRTSLDRGDRRRRAEQQGTTVRAEVVIVASSVSRRRSSVSSASSPTGVVAPPAASAPPAAPRPSPRRRASR